MARNVVSSEADQGTCSRPAPWPRRARVEGATKRAITMRTKSCNITKAASARRLPIAAIALALTLPGCVTGQSPTSVAAVPAAGPIPRGEAAITITRVGGYYAKAVAADVEVNGTKFASLDQGATFTGFVRP